MPARYSVVAIIRVWCQTGWGRKPCSLVYQQGKLGKCFSHSEHVFPYLYNEDLDSLCLVVELEDGMTHGKCSTQGQVHCKL